MNLHFNLPRPGCALAVRDISQLSDSNLLPEEAALLSATAVEKRRMQFALGRAAARQALTCLGFPSQAVLRGAGREPLWPPGIVGSITHCGSSAIAVVAKDGTARSIGIDLEDASRVITDEIVDVVASANERRWVFGGEDSQTRLAMLFSAKESIYKALYPLQHRFFDFHAVELSWIPERSSFLGYMGQDIEVGCQRSGNFVFTHAFV